MKPSRLNARSSRAVKARLLWKRNPIRSQLPSRAKKGSGETVRPCRHRRTERRRVPTRLPSGIRADEHAVLVTKARLAESAQVACAAERRLQVERDGCITIRIREDAVCPQREKAIAVR